MKRIGLQLVASLFFKTYLSHRSQRVIIFYCLSLAVKVLACHNGRSLVLYFFCYRLPLEDKLKKLGKKHHFYADDTVIFFVFGLTLCQFLFDDILTSIHRWFSNAKLMLNADKSEYMIIGKCKNCLKWSFTSAGRL